MLNSQEVRNCEFCEREEVEDYPQHLRSHHKMAGTADTQVKCMFCLEQMSELDMFSHVFYGHKISGMFFSSAGEEKDPTSTNTASVQTEETPDHHPASQRLEPVDRISADLEAADIEQSEPDDTEVETNPGCEEENLILLDDDESDFEMEVEGPLPDIYGPSNSSETEGPLDDSDGPTHKPENSSEDSQSEDVSESEVTFIQVKNSNNRRPSSDSIVDAPEPEVTLINVAKRKEIMSGLTPSPIKKVRFSDVTNYYPLRKRGKLKRGAKKPEPLILGANTSLKYLKYWGTTNKPD